MFESALAKALSIIASMNVTQISIGRFHHFHLARQLEKHKLLEAIYTGYPRFKLKDEEGVPPEKIITLPWLQAPYMVRDKLGLHKWEWLNRQWAWSANNFLDQYVSRRIKENSVLVALSGAGLMSGKVVQQKGGRYICDRGSTHIRFQNEVLKEEHARWNVPYQEIDSRSIAKEEAEYDLADRITVPSEFSYRSFLNHGVAEKKLAKIVYGARLDRFTKTGTPDESKFKVLWVGTVSLRKGFLYLLEAFQQLSHPNKELVVVGPISPEMGGLLKRHSLEKVRFLGAVPNAELPNVYSTSHVFVLPSIEDGFGMVMGEALACGCPVIATTNTGAIDLFEHRKEGFIIEIRSSKAIYESLQQLVDDSELRQSMSDAALRRVKQVGGWDIYGDRFSALVKSI
jgi:glycosyltransferase involved in cell wall biosynthesis